MVNISTELRKKGGGDHDIYDIRNPGSGLWQAQQSGRIKRVNGIPTLPSW